MTREEVIEEIKNYENYPNGLSKECRDYILKVLEQEPIIDKIRAEIEEQKQIDCFDSYDENEACKTGLEHAIDIIDKYKAESEK